MQLAHNEGKAVVLEVSAKNEVLAVQSKLQQAGLTTEMQRVEDRTAVRTSPKRDYDKTDRKPCLPDAVSISDRRDRLPQGSKAKRRCEVVEA